VVCVQRVHLATASVERQHVQAHQPFPVRVRHQQPFQFDDRGAVPATAEFGVPQVLPRGQPQLAQPVDLRDTPTREHGVVEHIAAPQRQCRATARDHAVRVLGHLTDRPDAPLEPVRVDHLRVDIQQVSRVARVQHARQPARTQRLPHPRHVAVQ
jgi:hypothetical protein